MPANCGADYFRCAEKRGHLASSLGAVELILSLLRSFDPAEDRILFDVGHQAYAYKLLTGGSTGLILSGSGRGQRFPEKEGKLLRPF